MANRQIPLVSTKLTESKQDRNHAICEHYVYFKVLDQSEM